KLIIWLAILGSMVYVGSQVIPILVNEYQFQDAMQTTARFASVSRQTPDDIRVSVMKQAANQDIPLTPKDIQVKAESGNIQISADYSVTVDLHVYQWTLNFHPSARNNALL